MKGQSVSVGMELVGNLPINNDSPLGGSSLLLGELLHELFTIRKTGYGHRIKFYFPASRVSVIP